MPDPAKASFQRLRPKDLSPDGPPLDVAFNPTEYTLTKGAQFKEVAMRGIDGPVLQYRHGQAESLVLDLFFDTTAAGMGAAAKPVTEQTDRFYELVKIDPDTHVPPICLFSWGGRSFPGASIGKNRALGSQQRYGFKCVVENVRQRYTLFSTTGIPLRATLTVTLKEYRTLKEQVDQIRLESADHTKVHAVSRGETLTQIADRTYGDPREWRRIAELNDIDDPLALPTGAVLEIPPSAA